MHATIKRTVVVEMTPEELGTVLYALAEIIKQPPDYRSNELQVRLEMAWDTLNGAQGKL